MVCELYLKKAVLKIELIKHIRATTFLGSDRKEVNLHRICHAVHAVPGNASTTHKPPGRIGNRLSTKGKVVWGYK